jgi:hypothetical protein
MAFDRAGEGNKAGIAAVVKHFDPLKQKNIMLKESLLKRLKMAAFLDDERSESQIIADALESVI